MGVTLQQRNIDLEWTNDDERRLFLQAQQPRNDGKAPSVVGYTIPRKKLCESYTRGHKCKRAPKKGGCPDAHDFKWRNEAKQTTSSAKASTRAQRLPWILKKGDQKPTKRLQGQSDLVSHKSKRDVAGPSDFKLPGLNTRNALNKPNQSDVGPTQTKTYPTSESIMSSQLVNPASNITSVPAADFTMLKLQDYHQKASRTPVTLDSTYPKNSSLDPICRTDGSLPKPDKGSDRFCIQFLKPAGCKYKENCKFVHDDALRRLCRECRQSKVLNARQETRFTGPTGNNSKPPGVKHHATESLLEEAADQPTAGEVEDSNILCPSRQISLADLMNSKVSKPYSQVVVPKLKNSKASRPYIQTAASISKDRKTTKSNNQTAATKSKYIKTTKMYSQVAAVRVKDNKEAKTGSEVMTANQMGKLQEKISEAIKVNQKWDNAELAEWAVRNIRSNQIKKHLLPHLSAGQSPIDFLNKRSEESKEKSVFHYFCQLPGEIRNQIWDRILDAESYDQRLTYRHEFTKEGLTYPARLLPQSITPRLLHVNMESRSRAKSRYDWVFASEHYGSMAWFNFERDTLLLHTANSSELALMLKLLMKTDRSRVLRLKIPLRDYLVNHREIGSLIARFKSLQKLKFKSLQKLKFMVGDSIEDRPWKSDTDLIASAQATIRTPWKQSHPNRRTPIVSLDVVDALRAHVMAIDGLKWY